MKDVRWLFFDLGDTLVDDTRSWLDLLDQLRIVLIDLGQRRDLDELMAMFEQVSAEYAPHPFAELQIRLGLDPSQREIVRSRTSWRHSLQEPIAGAKELLGALQSRYRLGVIANQAPGSEERCAAMGLRQYFSVFVASSGFGCSKPDPRIFHAALDLAQCPPEQAVMIGDRIDNDIRPAKLLGLRAIRLVRGCQRLQQPRDEWDVADATVYAPDEIQALLSPE